MPSARFRCWSAHGRRAWTDSRVSSQKLSYLRQLEHLLFRKTVLHELLLRTPSRPPQIERFG